MTETLKTPTAPSTPQPSEEKDNLMTKPANSATATLSPSTEVPQMPTAANDPFDPKALRLKAGGNIAPGVKKVLNRVPIKKPNKQDFFRIHPSEEYRLDLGLIELKDDNEYYAVVPALLDDLCDVVVPFTLYLAVTRQGTPFLYPARLPGMDGKDNPAWKSAREIAELGTKAWIRRQWNPSATAYDVYEATGILSEPDWPKETFGELLRIALGDKLIDDPGHLLIRQLRGEA